MAGRRCSTEASGSDILDEEERLTRRWLEDGDADAAEEIVLRPSDVKSHRGSNNPWMEILCASFGEKELNANVEGRGRNESDHKRSMSFGLSVCRATGTVTAW